MDEHYTKPKLTPNFRKKITFWIDIIGLLILTPFSINNFHLGRYLLGFGSLVIIIVLALSAICIKRKRYSPLVTRILAISILLFLLLSIFRQGLVGVFWCFPALISFYFILPERQAWVINGILIVSIIPLIYYIVDFSLWIRISASIIAVSGFAVVFIRVITQYQMIIEKLAKTDFLTGLMNRSMLNPVIEQAIQRNKRSGIDMSLLIMDIDYFKKVNDTYGHDVGDRVLEEIAEYLTKRLRAIDRIIRIGGEEFMILLFDTNMNDAIHVAEELRGSIASLPILDDRFVTVSIGVSSLNADDDIDTWMKRGDEKLYRAKSEGRNRVIS